MMAEALIKNPVCSKCGEGARPHALFCFACGGEVIESEQEDTVSSVWFREDLLEDKGEDSEPAFEKDGMASEAEGDEQSSDQEKDAETETVESEPKVSPVRVRRVPVPQKKLTSAADLRKRPKPVQAKRVEIVWKEKHDSPNLMFVVCGTVMALLALFIFFAAMYLK